MSTVRTNLRTWLHILQPGTKGVSRGINACVRPSFDRYSVTRRKVEQWRTDNGNHTAVLPSKRFNCFRGLDSETGPDKERE